MQITIIGWYGTETMGDKAILDGLLSVFSEIDPHARVFIGSLFPFYTQRTLVEERNVFFGTANSITISVFPIKDRGISERAILDSNLLVLGGGPLMDIDEMKLVHWAFVFAERKGIKTAVLGCGVGPLHDMNHMKRVKAIFDKSDLVVLRDTIAEEKSRKIGYDGDACTLGDPAIISVQNFLMQSEESEKKYSEDNNYVAVNFRDYPRKAYGGDYSVEKEEYTSLVKALCKKYDTVYLVPMHNFFIGGDDRLFLSDIGWECECKVIHKPFDLWELYRIFRDAKGCIGMRYHSIVMQSILNGNNYILDYTDPENGKIRGFIDDADKDKFYDDRVTHIHNGEHIVSEEIINVLERNERFDYTSDDIKNAYTKALRGILE